jgi:hypothetical protein
MATAQANVSQTQRQIIVPTTTKAGWLDAIELVRNRGGLPSNALHDRYLVETNDYQQIRGLYPAWTNGVLVYPERNGVFGKGDIEDASKDNAGRKWVVPASCVPEQVIGVTGVALYIDPENVEVTDKRVAIIAKPESIRILAPFMQKNGWGKMDEVTRVPLALPEDSNDKNNRYLWRIDGIGVRPLVRGWYGGWNGRRVVNASIRDDGGFGVAGTSIAQAEPKPITIAPAQENSGVLVKGVTLHEFNIMVRDARASVEELEEVVKEGKLKPVHNLLRTLEL